MEETDKGARMAQGHKTLKQAVSHLVLPVTVGKSLNLLALVFWAVKHVKKAKFLSNKILFLQSWYIQSNKYKELNKTFQLTTYMKTLSPKVSFNVPRYSAQ